MLGEKLGEERGKVTSRRVLPSDGGPKVETSFASTGKLLGKDVQDIGTYWAQMRPDGTLFGDGQGVIMTADGGAASWRGNGIGRIGAGGAVSFRGAIYYQTASPDLAQLNGTVGVFEYEVDANDNTHGQIWEWK
jgi:hypothetical protein